jgi:hypothetical protein
MISDVREMEHIVFVDNYELRHLRLLLVVMCTERVGGLLEMALTT